MEIRIRGIVQGVGFRPSVLRIARRNQVAGWVRNTTWGVQIRAEGEPWLVASFIDDLQLDSPAAARIESLEVEDTRFGGFTGFEIRASDDGGGDRRADSAGNAEGVRRTGIAPDLATCDHCRAELFDEGNRRFHYPFINCTDCGPRFTIIDDLPYDRPATSMRGFAMCPSCAREYADPSDRRFHAQPDACFACGPQISLLAPDGTALMSAQGAGTDERRQASDAIVARVAALLRDGKIVAIKGLGGFHLACDARDARAVETLRTRKRRDGKPFAILVGGIDDARLICRVSEAESALMRSPAAPIVLLERLPHPDPAWALAPNVTGALDEVGVMLPSTPLQHLIMAQVGFPLVMTSGNISDEPIVSTGREAVHRLGGIVDALLDNNRPIVSRYDDSVARIVGGRRHLIRRARGFAPLPIGFPRPQAPHGRVPVVLGTGPQQKATFTLAIGTRAYVSQHIGDLGNADTLDVWRQTLARYQRLFSAQPRVVAHDLHPGYLSTTWACEQARDHDIELVGVQHHHAHIAAVMGEHIAAGRLAADERVIGVALDGTGFGTDGTIWGGEVLCASLGGFERMAHLLVVPLPGGEGAIRHPARMALSLLIACGLADHPGAAAVLDHLGADAAFCARMIAAGVNAPLTSSAGRLFDAMSALAGCCHDATYDGEAPMLLEAALHRAPGTPGVNASGLPDAADDSRWCFGLEDGPDGCLIIDPAPVVKAMLDDRAAGCAAPLLSLRFHDAFAHALARACEAVRRTTGLSRVALSGGVMTNRYLSARLPQVLEQAGFEVLQHIALPANDGCVSYGQAVVAAARLDAAAGL